MSMVNCPVNMILYLVMNCRIQNERMKTRHSRCLLSESVSLPKSPSSSSDNTGSKKVSSVSIVSVDIIIPCR